MINATRYLRIFVPCGTFGHEPIYFVSCVTILLPFYIPGNPVYTPETLTKTTMVNFAVKEQGLTSQLLGIVVRKERPQLEQMKDNLVMTIANNKKVLVR